MNARVQSAPVHTGFVFSFKKKIAVFMAIIFSCCLAFGIYRDLSSVDELTKETARDTNSSTIASSPAPEISSVVDTSDVIAGKPLSVALLSWDDRSLSPSLPSGVHMVHSSSSDGKVILFKKWGRVVRMIPVPSEIGAVENSEVKCIKSDEERCAFDQWSFDGNPPYVGRVIRAQIKDAPYSEYGTRYYFEINGKPFFAIETRVK